MTLSVTNLFRIKEIRTKIMITLGLLFCYRVGFFVPLPGVNLEEFLRPAVGNAEGFGKIINIMNVLTGGNLQSASLFSLGVMPYISSSIIFSLLSKVVPSLEKIAKEGPSGQRKINRYTRFATVPICLVQSMIVFWGTLMSGDARMLHAGMQNYALLYMILVVICLTAGTLFIMWLGEQITEHGVGNGISMIIMAGIVANLPAAFYPLFAASEGSGVEAWQTLLLFIGAWVLAVVAVVHMTKAQRRIPIQQAKHTRGRRVYGGQRHFLPLKVNHAGVMPIIFASALLIIPPIFGEMLGWGFLADFAAAQGFWYITLYAGLIYFFSFFWTSMMFQPNEMAENLKEGGSFIPGIRPGKNTAGFLENTMVRITLAGATFLAIVAVFPTFITGSFQGLDQTLLYFMSGTSILIVVGVALDLVEKVNALLVMRNYEGFMRDNTGTSTGWGKKR
ncbi:MAG: preprotein translocase subunit SecY [Planctomycetota bacterium]|jgi:preprotein translocase subunit SecY